MEAHACNLGSWESWGRRINSKLAWLHSESLSQIEQLIKQEIYTQSPELVSMFLKGREQSSELWQSSHMHAERKMQKVKEVSMANFWRGEEACAPSVLWHTREDQNQEQPLNSVTEVSIGRINGRAETDIGIAASKRQAIVLQIVSKK